MSRPQHIGIIMDGNGRWAQEKNRPRTYGHIKGAQIAKQIITQTAELGVPYLTLYAFSTENWLRPRMEVDFLFKLLHHHLSKETKTLVKENIRFQAIGELERLPPYLLLEVQKSEQQTAHCTGLRVFFAISYGARAEITRVARELAKKAISHGLLPEKIDEAFFEQQLTTFPAPELDLIIRTGGEKRLSNFLLWQAAYSELYFTDTLWPEFTEAEFLEAIGDFTERDRRFGRIKQHANISY